jgi:hypothetical protein
MNNIYNYYKKFAYIFLIFLFFIVILNTFHVKNSIVKRLSFREKTNLNSNFQEGFGGIIPRKKASGAIPDNDNIYNMIDRKLKGLTEELGGDTGKRETKDILINTKKICDLECAKCIMNMMEENKGVKSIDLDRLARDNKSEYCVKCKKYTELSSSIKSMIDNL